MDDNVISFGSRRNYRQEQAERKEAIQVEVDNAEKQMTEAQSIHKETILKMLQDTIKLVETDQLEGVLVLGRHKSTKLFFTDLVVDERITPPQEMFSYVGCLETLKMEFAEMAAMAPCLRANGTILDPSVPYAGEEACHD